MTSAESPTAIRACWLAWIAVRTSDQAEVATQLGLTNLRQASWTSGAGLIDDIAHSGDARFSTVVVTPAIEG